MNKNLVLIILLFFTFYSKAQIINVEKSRKVTDTIGFAGGLALWGSYLDNEVEFLDISVLPDLQYKTENDLFLLIGSYSLTKTNDIDFQNSGMLHLRYNRKLNSLLRLEAFQQIQKDEINRIQYRYLSGAGPRFKLLDKEIFKFYLGVLPMLELELADEPSNRFQRDLRLSNYVSLSYYPNENVTLYSTTYYQPDVNLWGDYRVHNENQLAIALGKRTSFDLTTRYSFDSEPPLDAPSRFVSLSGGFSLRTN